MLNGKTIKCGKRFGEKKIYNEESIQGKGVCEKRGRDENTWDFRVVIRGPSGDPVAQPNVRMTERTSHLDSMQQIIPTRLGTCIPERSAEDGNEFPLGYLFKNE